MSKIQIDCDFGYVSFSTTEPGKYYPKILRGHEHEGYRLDRIERDDTGNRRARFSSGGTLITISFPKPVRV